MLELGGNAACIVEPDWPLDDAVERMVTGAFYQSGQSCISVQRILLHETIYDAFKAKFVAKTKALVAGDPKREETFIGPMISESEAKRLEGWIKEAVRRRRARALRRRAGRRHGASDRGGERAEELATFLPRGLWARGRAVALQRFLRRPR